MTQSSPILLALTLENKPIYTIDRASHITNLVDFISKSYVKYNLSPMNISANKQLLWILEVCPIGYIFTKDFSCLSNNEMLHFYTKISRSILMWKTEHPCQYENRMIYLYTQNGCPSFVYILIHVF